MPDLFGRYYGVQFTDPFHVDFAYAGTRTTGTKAGDYLGTKPGQKGAVSQGMKRLSSPNISALVLGAILVYSDRDFRSPTTSQKQKQLTPLNQQIEAL